MAASGFARTTHHPTYVSRPLARGTPGLEHVAKKWTQFSAPNDAPLEGMSIGLVPKVDSTFGSDALSCGSWPSQMLEGMTRRGGTACRMERQALHNAIQRFNAEGPDGLHDRPFGSPH